VLGSIGYLKGVNDGSNQPVSNNVFSGELNHANAFYVLEVSLSVE
jgi:hypothetical protein